LDLTFFVGQLLDLLSIFIELTNNVHTGLQLGELLNKVFLGAEVMISIGQLVLDFFDFHADSVFVHESWDEFFLEFALLGLESVDLTGEL